VEHSECALVFPPPARHNKNFCAAFFKKRLLSFF
jgi:hypothetical protein